MITNHCERLLVSGDFYPHGFCYLSDKGLAWLHVVCDSLIAAAYFVIPVILLWSIRERHDLPSSWMFALFGIFIIACGVTHVTEVWNLWPAQYCLADVIKAVTAAASVSTAILLARLIPQALEIPSAHLWIETNAGFDRQYADRLFTALQRLHPVTEFRGTDVRLATG